MWVRFGNEETVLLTYLALLVIISFMLLLTESFSMTLAFGMISYTIIAELRHTVVCCVAREPKCSEYIYRKNKIAIFMQAQLSDALTKWHQIYNGVALHIRDATFKIKEIPLAIRKIWVSKFFHFFPPLFCTLCKNCYNTHIGAPICLNSPMLSVLSLIWGISWFRVPFGYHSGLGIVNSPYQRKEEWD